MRLIACIILVLKGRKMAGKWTIPERRSRESFDQWAWRIITSAEEAHPGRGGEVMKAEIARTKRERSRSQSNNRENPNKNKCALAVAKALGVADRVHYLHTIDDLTRALRTQFSVRSRKSSLPKNATVGKARLKAPEFGAKYYVALVPGHVILLGRDGKTLIDTAPRKVDRRKVLKFYGVFPKKQTKPRDHVKRPFEFFEVGPMKGFAF
jgi:hypothetical protein